MPPVNTLVAPLLRPIVDVLFRSAKRVSPLYVPPVMPFNVYRPLPLTLKDAPGWPAPQLWTALLVPQPR